MTLYSRLGLSDFEYSQIAKKLKREPNELETYLFSAMWSEHCGYKHSKNYIKNFPKTNSVCPDENSGGIEIGSHIIFFKAESHNHPSAVEPFQGAATGIGGIIRDILTLGARPIALMDSLKFGNLDNGRNKYLLEGVVSGISFYGNCIGVPTIGGETNFDNCFSSNPLVNVLAIGIANKQKIVKSIARENCIILLLGSSTGRDGIHGASFASKEMEDKQEDKLSVQIADPFMKKNVIEASLEILNLEGIIAAQDCGAAGILSSTSEMGYKGKCAIELYLDKVHLREKDMQPWEIMLSESQERMIFAVKPEVKDKVFKIAEKYCIQISEIGKTTKGRDYNLYWDGKLLSNTPLEVLNNCVAYELNAEEPAYIKIQKNKILKENDLSAKDIIELLKSPDISNKKYIFSQYDHTVGNRTVLKPSKSSVSALRVKEENTFIAFTMDSDFRKVYLNPFEGAKCIVYESFRNMTAAGFIPDGITDCLNFANPEKNETAYAFVKSVEGITRACKELNIPVVSGNVSFYNETDETSVYPCPVIGMIGRVNKNILKNNVSDNEYIYLLGKEISLNSHAGGSFYQKLFYDFLGGEIDVIDSAIEIKISNAILDLIEKNLITACNDVSKGGIFISLFEILYNSDIGFKGSLTNGIKSQKLLFGEITGRYIISSKTDIENELKGYNIPFKMLGKSKKDTLEFDGFSFKIKELFEIYKNAFETELKN